MNANGPIRQGYETEVTALAFAEDPELGTISTPHGQVQFLAVAALPEAFVPGIHVVPGTSRLIVEVISE